MDLSQVWTLLILIFLLKRKRNLLNGIILGLFITFTVGVSNYLGLFSLIFFGLYESVSLFQVAICERKNPFNKDLCLFYLSFVTSFTAITLLYFIPYMKYFQENPESSGLLVNRSINDVFIFSTRPWYYILPSVDNPFYGHISQVVINILQKFLGWQAANYFKSEHSASYLGITNIFLAVLGLVYLRKQTNFSVGKRNFLMRIFIVGVAFFLISMPPYFSLFGIKIYMPSYLLGVTIPVFRVLARVSFIIYIVNLLFAGYGILFILSKFESRKNLSYILVTWLLLISLSELYIPIKITKITESPKVFDYLKDSTENSDKIITYPYNKVITSQLWMNGRIDRLINMRYIMNIGKSLDSENFTKSLVTTEGLGCAKSLGAEYLIYFYESDPDRKINQEFLNNSAILLQDFSEEGSDLLDLANLQKFVIISDVGAVKSNSARLYKLNTDTTHTYNCPSKNN
jgi:hypothetical protein